MTFIQEAGSSDWLEYNKETHTATNYYGVSHIIDVDSNNFYFAKFKEAKDWHEIFVTTSYCCLNQGISDTIWLSPKGISFPCESHTVAAQSIVAVLYGEANQNTFEETLIKRNWIRLTTNSTLLKCYIDQGHYQDMTQEQQEFLLLWCKRYHVDIQIFKE